MPPPADPKTAEIETRKWYYMIYPPSGYGNAGSANVGDCSWPSEYDGDKN